MLRAELLPDRDSSDSSRLQCVAPILAAAGNSWCELLIQIFRIRGVDLEYGEATIGGSGGYRALDSTHPSAEGSLSHSVKL